MKLRTEHVDWMQMRHVSLTTSILPIPPYVEWFTHEIFPSALEYFSPLNAVFLFQFPGLKSLNLKSSWLIRDGEVPLHHFFSIHPDPIGVKSKIYVEESLAWLVPRSWKSKTGTYRVVSKKPSKPVDKCMIFGIGSAEVQSLSQLKTRLESLESKKIKALAKELYLPFRWISNNEDELYPYRCISLLRSHIGQNIRAVNWSQMKLKNSYDGYLFLDLTSRRYCADSYVTHIVLSRGAFLPSSLRTGKQSCSFVALSPYHGLEVSDKIGRYSMPRNASINFESKFPWREWFVPWSQIGT
jgi:hypothetical protein